MLLLRTLSRYGATTATPDERGGTQADLCLSQISSRMRTWGLLVFPHILRSAVRAFHVLAATVSATFKSRAALQLENLALRHQLGVLQRSVKRPGLTSPDRLLWAWLCEILDRLEIGACHRQTAHRDRLAPERLPSLLDVEDPAR